MGAVLIAATVRPIIIATQGLNTASAPNPVTAIAVHRANTVVTSRKDVRNSGDMAVDRKFAIFKSAF